MVSCACRFGLVLRHALQPADRRDAGQHPGELGVLRHRRLHHDRGLLRIDARGQKQRGDLQDLGAQLGRLLINRDGVQIDDAEDALVVVLDLDPVLQRAQIISDVQIAGRLNAGEDACFHVESTMVPFRLPIQETLTIEKLVYGGEGLARLDGKVVLTPFVLPGEVVRAEIDRAKNDLWRGRVIEVSATVARANRARMPVFPALRRVPVSAHRLSGPVGAEARDSARGAAARGQDRICRRDRDHRGRALAVSQSRAASHRSMARLGTSAHGIARALRDRPLPDRVAEAQRGDRQDP